MRCPHCLVEIHAKRIFVRIGDDTIGAWAIEKHNCPNVSCLKLICYLVQGEFISLNTGVEVNTRNGIEVINMRYLIKPKGSSRPPVPKEVPGDIAEDYTEACIVLPDSPKASAALSRRCLQHLLRRSAGVKPGNLVVEIQ